MSGLMGSSGRCETAPHTLDGPTTLAAAVMPPKASAYDMKSRLLRPRSATLVDMDASFPFPDVCRSSRHGITELKRRRRSADYLGRCARHVEPMSQPGPNSRPRVTLAARYA